MDLIRLQQLFDSYTEKFETFNTKIIDFKTDLEKYQFKIDKLINSMQNDIESILKEKIGQYALPYHRTVAPSA